ncbi:hypothetical protein BGZ58_003723 [Dissophora ornata]|nr:hypothetical protein BGZ58_003723 [Dissophora ornata]
MRGTGKNTAKDPEGYEDQFLHQTIGSSRIRSHSTKYGSHKIHRHNQFTAGASSSSLPSAAASAPGAAGATASSVSAYLENLPSVNLGVAPPPRPPRPPGGLLGISNGRGIGYGRSLGSSYDSPLTIHGSFNGHVRSGANLYGGKNQSSGLLPVKPSSAHHRPSMSVFPIQKALEIAMKESRLLAAASSRGGSGPSGTGMSSGATFVRELRRARHARGAIITEHGPTPDISLDEDEEDDVQAEDADGDTRAAQDHSVNSNNGNDDWHMHGQGDIRIQRPTVVSFDAKTHYPGADMTLASPMTHKTPLDLAESRLSYLLSRAQESVKQSQSSGSTSSTTLDLHNSQIATLSSFHTPPAQSPALLYQIRGIVNLLRPYVVRQQKLQHGERQTERQKERSWERADKYMRQHHHHRQDQAGGSSSSGMWRVDPHSEDNFGDMEDEDEDDEEEDDHMDTEDRRRPAQKGLSMVDGDGDLELNDDDGDVDKGRTSYSMKSKKLTRRPVRRMDADETEEALESLMNGLSLLEANRRQLERQQQHPEQQSQPFQQQQQQQQAQLRGGMSDITDGNLADSELDPRSEQEVEEALPDLLEQVQQVLEAIKLNEAS